MMSLFVNRGRKIRSGWKIAMVLAIFLVSSFTLSVVPIIVYIVSLLFTIPKGGRIPFPDMVWQIQQRLMSDRPLMLVLTLIQAICMIATVWLILRLVDKKRISYIGLTSLKSGWKDLFYGLVLGAASMTFIFVTLLAAGNITLENSFSRPNLSASLFTGLVMFIFVGLNEELFARGYCLKVLGQTGSRWVPAVMSSVIFSLLHILNPNVSLLGMLNIFLVGLLFAFMTLRTGNLWMAIGYHITWNYFQGNIFGFPVSGTEPDGIYNLALSSENLLNGGSFGPEGGILATFVIAAGFLLIRRHSGEYNRAD